MQMQREEMHISDADDCDAQPATDNDLDADTAGVLNAYDENGFLMQNSLSGKYTKQASG